MLFILYFKDIVFHKNSFFSYTYNWPVYNTIIIFANNTTGKYILFNRLNEHEFIQCKCYL